MYYIIVIIVMYDKILSFFTTNIMPIIARFFRDREMIAKGVDKQIKKQTKTYNSRVSKSKRVKNKISKKIAERNFKIIVFFVLPFMYSCASSKIVTVDTFCSVAYEPDHSLEKSLLKSLNDEKDAIKKQKFIDAYDYVFSQNVLFYEMCLNNKQIKQITK